MYRNIGPCYCNSGLSLEVSLSSQWSLVTGFTVYIILIFFFKYNFKCEIIGVFQLLPKIL